jgi:hypothetical protein
MVPGSTHSGIVHSGVVHSVFANSYNIAIADLLVTVHGSSIPHTPTSVRVADPAGHHLVPAVRPGQPVHIEQNLIRVESIGGASYAVDMSQASVWSPDPARHIAATQAQQAVTRLAAVEHTHPLGGIASASDLEARVLALQRSLLDHVERRAPERGITRAAAELIGLGPGLTPSGDDVLVGVMAALTRGGDAAAIQAALEAISRAVAQREQTTSDVSRHYLRLATRGHFSQSLTELLDALTRSSLAEQDRCIRQLLTIGSSSGADTLAGIALGMAAIAARTSNGTIRGNNK